MIETTHRISDNQKEIKMTEATYRKLLRLFTRRKKNELLAQSEKGYYCHAR